MIVKFPPPRRDGNTDFNKLRAYLTDGLAARGADISTHSFDRLTQYITAEDVLDGFGDAVEKTLAVEIGNLHSLDTAADEMWAVANQNARCKDPVLHYILSWPEHERPPVADIFGAARHTLKALGLDAHQYIIAIHVNTDNVHAHVEVNRVHPETYKSRHLEWAHKTVHKAAREAEIMYGWSHDNGLWVVVEVDGKPMVVPNDKYQDPDVAQALSERARTHETWTGTESLETWCRGEPAAALQKALTDKRLASWPDVHRVLSPFGLTVEPSGGGGYKIFSGKGTPDENVVAASKAFRFLKFAQLEKAIGPFIAPTPEDLAHTTPDQPPGRIYKRDPIKRTLRREERRESRDALFDRFNKERQRAIAVRDATKAHFRKSQAELEKRHLASMARQYRDDRDRLKADASISPPQKQALYSLMRVQYEAAVKAQRAKFTDARREFSRMLPPLMSWRAWVTEQASRGDEAAVSALRGIVYRERRAGETPPDDNEVVEATNEMQAVARLPAITAHPARYDDPTLNRTAALTWSVTTNGRIVYRFRGAKQPAAFIDAGPAVSFVGNNVTDDALRAALLHARQKWGPTLRLDGGDRIFRERVARMALELGYRIENRDLRELQTTLLETRRPPAPQSLLPRREKSTDELLGELLHKHPGATHHHANPAKTYDGRILGITSTHVVQQLASGTLILHDTQRMATLPKVNKDVTIRYRDGVATYKRLVRKER